MLAEAASATDTSAVIAALRKAATATGSDFNYLLGTAMRESSLKPQAQSSTSSAAGLFQFVEQTWLGLVKEHGAKYGLGSMAGAITKESDGRFRTDNAADHQAILALRKDPQVAALMAGEYSNATRATLEASLGRGVCGGELYAAHFLGADAACRLIRMNSAAPGTNAAQAFPAAAASNRSVFYRPDGSAKSVREVYDWALKQPGGAAPIARTEAKVSATFASATAPDQNIETLLANVMNWRPAHGFFAMGGEMTDSAPNSSPLMLTADMLKVLSSNG